MSIPSLQPPTDNLYKFMAILGLLLWVGGVIYPWTKAFELESRVIDLSAEIKRANLDIANADPIDLRRKTEQVQLTLRSVMLLFGLGIISMAGGGLLMLFGFRWWYQRVQRYLDRELANRASAPNPAVNTDVPPAGLRPPGGPPVT